MKGCLVLEVKMKKIIAFGADSGYQDKVETAIKSICAHNRECKFYIFNDDLPTEWFLLMEKRLEPLSSEIVNVKITSHNLREYRLPYSSITYAAFFRYFIPKFVTEDKVLYLDSDIIVRSSIDELFSYDLGDSPLAAVADPLDSSTFNSGMMLINADLWRKESATDSLLDLTNQFHQEVYGDQGILNLLFKDRWRPLSQRWNFMVGMDTTARNCQVDSWYSESIEIEKDAAIIHFTGDKPWANINLNRFRKDWWFYYGLEWSDIVMRKGNFKVGFNSLVSSPPRLYSAVFTNTCDIEAIEYLIKELPQVHFSILAYTRFAPNIVDLQKYLNVRIYPVFNPMNFIKILEEIDFYLDINHEGEIANIIDEVYRIGKPIFAFDNTCHNREKASFICDHSHPEDMVSKIGDLIDNKELD